MQAGTEDLNKFNQLESIFIIQSHYQRKLGVEFAADFLCAIEQFVLLYAVNTRHCRQFCEFSLMLTGLLITPKHPSYATLRYRG